MKANEFLKTRKGQLILVIGLLLLSQVFLFATVGKSFLDDLPDQKKFDRVNKELKARRAEYEKYNRENREFKKVKDKYQVLASTAWIQEHDGVVETTLRARISDVAGKMQFRLNNIGAVRTGRLNEKFYYAEIDINGSGDIEDVIRLLAELRKIEPVLAWRRLDLRPDFRYRRNTGTGSANLASRLEIPPTRLNFSGALRVLCYDGELTVKDLKITRPSLVELERENARQRRQIPRNREETDGQKEENK